MSTTTHQQLTGHLLRRDGQEDVCLATYATSTGATRTTRLLTTVVLPQAYDRAVHGNASFRGEYVLRAASDAARRGEGVAILHSHPGAQHWQALSGHDHDAEQSYAALAGRITGLPLVGLTLAGGDQTWSARTWHDSRPRWVESVRVVGPTIDVSWNEALLPAPRSTPNQARTITAWGERAQASIARLRVLIVGAGSVGLDVAQRLAATGIQQLAVMDYDVVETVNLDRMIGATRRDARLRRPKVDVAQRLMRAAATANTPAIQAFDTSICSPQGLAAALDFDVIFSCVDRPWPRAALNSLAFADLIPVIDGGISIESLPNGTMRGASWRAHTLVPERPCLACSRQLALRDVPLDIEGLLDDPEYIQQSGRQRTAGSPNVAALSAGVSAAQLAQFVILTAHPGDRGVPSPLRYVLTPPILEHLNDETKPHCPIEASTAIGDSRSDLTRPTGPWVSAHRSRNRRRTTPKHIAQRWSERLAWHYLHR